MAKKKTSNRKPPKPSNSEPQREVTAIELAHLTASLVAANILPSPQAEDEEPSEHKAKWNHRSLIGAAIEFLEICEEIQVMRRKAEEWRGSNLKLQEALLKEDPKETVSIRRVLELAKVNRIKLTKVELAKLHIHRLWDRLDKDEQARAIYLCLSHRASNFGTFSYSRTGCERIPLFNGLLFGDTANQEKQITDGISRNLLSESNLIEALQEAKKRRESENKSEAARKSRETAEN